ncbi:MAG: two-component system, cell cycle sensor histidine kinase and response regulator CckA [Actinomycetota bacterium]|jgi:nitrogen-specific signal transduction histidine kinase|nr:two-component system, cell cycle sensor histidine kinase and response regulator CckA [Actinomycetota bacterium]
MSFKKVRLGAAAEREAIESSLRQAEKMEAVGQLAGGIAHDFNNLLAVIQNYTRFVHDDLPESDPRRADLAEVMKAGERGADLVRQLLTFSRKEIVEPEIIDLNASVVEIAHLIRRVLSESTEIVTSLEPDLDAIEADRSQVDQVLMNLSMNAADAMPDGGTLEIRCFNCRIDERTSIDELRPGDYVCLTVSDNGQGMDPAVLSRAFEPFFTTKGRSSGTGLGLASVYGIVQRSRGHIEVKSGPGEGTSVTIYFPSAQGSPTKVLEASPPIGATILIADDEEPIRKFLKRLLERAGHTVIVGDDPHDALELARTATRVDLLLTDVVMPDMSGKELADRAGVLRPGLRTLFMSGYPEDILVAHQISIEGDNYIQKPFSGEALVSKIGSILGESFQEVLEVGR